MLEDRVMRTRTIGHAALGAAAVACAPLLSACGVTAQTREADASRWNDNYASASRTAPGGTVGADEVSVHAIGFEQAMLGDPKLGYESLGSSRFIAEEPPVGGAVNKLRQTGARRGAQLVEWAARPLNAASDDAGGWMYIARFYRQSDPARPADGWHGSASVGMQD